MSLSDTIKLNDNHNNEPMPVWGIILLTVGIIIIITLIIILVIRLNKQYTHRKMSKYVKQCNHDNLMYQRERLITT